MNTKELDFYLPDELIAQQALSNRSQSRLLVLPRWQGAIEQKYFADIINHINKGDCLVLNQTKVIPARFYLKRATSGKIEGLFLEINQQGFWRAMLKGATRLKPDEIVDIINPLDSNYLADPIKLKIIAKEDQGIWLLENISNKTHLDILDNNGLTPLPPYIHRQYSQQTEEYDRQRYQTVYAQNPGSVAAPTAGLHFTPELLDDLQQKGIKIAKVTLNVGMGTFKPVTADNLNDHQIHSEEYHIDQQNADIVNETIKNKGRIIAVGTTSVRTLETVAQDDGYVKEDTGSTQLFIMPGYKYKIVNGIITNFHLPRSTLLALICAFSTHQRIMNAYKLAIEEKYRFYSYGDAMMII